MGERKKKKENQGRTITESHTIMTSTNGLQLIQLRVQIARILNVLEFRKRTTINVFLFKREKKRKRCKRKQNASNGKTWTACRKHARIIFNANYNII